MKYCRPAWLADKKYFHFKSSKTARKTEYLQEAGDFYFHHKKVFITKLCRISSKSLHIVMVFRGLKLRFDVLNVFNCKS